MRWSMYKKIFFWSLFGTSYLDAKPQVSLTAPNCNHFGQVSLMVLDLFLDAFAKAKKLIHKSIARFTEKEIFSFGNGI